MNLISTKLFNEKPLLSILISFFFSSTLQTQGKFEWFIETEFSEVHLPGSKYLFYQFCSSNEDSLISNGSVNFRKAIMKE